MLPAARTDSSVPFTNFHFVGPPFESHQFFSKLSRVPSKRTMASLGGWPTSRPGSTLTGFGRFMSWTAQACFASGVSP